MGIPDHLSCLLRNLYAGKEVTESHREQQAGSKLGKEYIKAVYCNPAYLTYMQGTLYEMPLDKAQAGIARRNIITSDIHITSPLWQRVKKN